MLLDGSAGERCGRWLVRLRVSDDSRCAIVGVLALTVTASYGVLMYAYPVVLPAMQAEFGWAQHILTGAWSLGALAGGVAAIPVGRWVDRNGPRGVMTLCGGAASGLVVAWSRVESPGALYVVWIGLGACSAGLFYEPAFATVAQWSRHRRTRAITVVTVAGGLASTIFVPLTGWLTQQLGWRAAILGLASVLATLPALSHALLPPGRPPYAGRYGDDIPTRAARVPAHPSRAVSEPCDAVRSASLRWLILAVSLATLASTAFLVHLIPILLAAGHDLAVGTVALAAAGVTKLMGRVLFAPLMEWVGIGRVGALVPAMQALGVLVLAATSSLNGLVVCILLFGMGEGAGTAARAELIAEFHGTTGYGAASGVMALFLATARALGPVAASFALAATGAYGATLVALIVILLLAAAAVLPAARSAARDVADRASFPLLVRLPSGAGTYPKPKTGHYDGGASHDR